MWKIIWIFAVFLLITEGFVSGFEIKTDLTPLSRVGEFKFNQRLKFKSTINPDQQEIPKSTKSNNETVILKNNLQTINHTNPGEERISSLIVEPLKGLNNILNLTKKFVYFFFGYDPAQEKYILLQLQNRSFGFIDMVQGYILKAIDSGFNLARYFNNSVNFVFSGFVKIFFDGIAALETASEKVADVVNSFINGGMFVGKRVTNFFLVIIYYGYINIRDGLSIAWVFFFEFVRNIPILGRIIGLKEYTLDKIIEEISYQVDSFVVGIGNSLLKRKDFILPRLSYLVSLAESLGDIFNKLTDDPRFHFTNNEILKSLTYFWKNDVTNILKYLERYFESDGAESFLDNANNLLSKTWDDIENDVPT